MILSVLLKQLQFALRTVSDIRKKRGCTDGIGRSDKMKYVMLVLVCLFVPAASGIRAEDDPLPDDLTLNVGAVGNVGTNVTLVLKKRSIRSDTYALVLETADGPRQMDPFPVRTYRGYVKDDPIVRVNADIEPSGVLNANFSEGQDLVGQIVGLKIDIPPGPSSSQQGESAQESAAGTNSTPLMSAGNKVVPTDSLSPRPVADPRDILPPRYPMRRARFTVNVENDYIQKIGNDIEQAVVEAEQRINAADFVYARDISVAWELNTLIIKAGGADLSKYQPLRDIAMDSPERKSEYRARFWCRRNVFAAGEARVGGTGGTSASVLLHEMGHAFGTAHHLDDWDCMKGCHENVGPQNARIMLRGCGGLPVVIYSGALPPCAVQDFANTWKDTPVTIDVLENDYDGNGDTLWLQSVQEKSRRGGSVAVSEDKKRAVYTPAPGFIGQDRFSYTVVDGTGAGSRSGDVKVDVRTDGLASWFSFEEAKQDGIAWLWEEHSKVNNCKTWSWVYGAKDRRPKDKKLAYHFPDLVGYGRRGTAHWIEYEPVKGVSGNGLRNPPGGNRFAQVVFRDIGDPGRWSLSASLWVLYPEGVKADGVILSKGALCYSSAIDWVVNGWAIAHRAGRGFKFMGNTERMRDDERFTLESQAVIQPNTWYHLVMVIDRESKKLRAWVNNEEVLTSEPTTTVPDGVIAGYAPMIMFNGFSWRRWNASSMLVDELKIFTSALKPEQVAELYAEGKNAKIPD